MTDRPQNEMESQDTAERERRDSTEAAARTVEEAIELALRRLGAKREEAEVEVLNPGRSGFLGFGAEMARVRATRLPQSGGLARAAKEVVDTLIAGMGVSAVSTIGKAPADAPDTSLIEITGEDSGLLIGRRGDTLRALQFMVNLLLRDRLPEGGGRVFLDVERYRQRRTRVLTDLALRLGDRVAASGRAITLEPMPPAERRAIHLALADHPRVQTVSVGEGDERKVTIAPKRTGEPPTPRPPRPGPRLGA